MEATINTTLTVSSNSIIIGGRSLSDILSTISKHTHDCIMDISIQRQSEKPDLEMIDTPLHIILNLLEDISR